MSTTQAYRDGFLAGQREALNVVKQRDLKIFTHDTQIEALRIVITKLNKEIVTWKDATKNAEAKAQRAQMQQEMLEGQIRVLKATPIIFAADKKQTVPEKLGDRFKLIELE